LPHNESDAEANRLNKQSALYSNVARPRGNVVVGPRLGNLLGGYRFPRRVSDQANPRMRGFQKRHFSFTILGKVGKT